jgi:hypothetical protein
MDNHLLRARLPRQMANMRRITPSVPLSRMIVRGEWDSFSFRTRRVMPHIADAILRKHGLVKDDIIR